MRQNTEIEFMNIVKSALTTDAGASLLTALKERYQNQPMFSPDVAIMARNVAKADLIQELEFYISATDDDLTVKESPDDHPFN